MTDGTLAHLPASRSDTAASGTWAAMREQVREIIRAEVGRLNPTDDARRPLELIIESSVRYSAADDGTRISVVDARGQPRTVERDGKLAAFTIRDLLDELRLTHPALFRSSDRIERPAGASVREGPPPRRSRPEPAPVEEPVRPRDWLSVGSGRDAAEPSRNRKPFRLRRGKVRLHGWSRKATGSPEASRGTSSPAASSPAPGAPGAGKVPELQFVPDRTLFSLDRVRNVFGGTRSKSRARGQALGVAAVALLTLLGVGASAFLGRTRSPPEAVAEGPAATGAVREAQATEAEPTRPLLSRARALRGVPEVIDTATLSLQGEVIRLFGVEWAPGGGKPEDLAHYLQGRETVCDPMGANEVYRCQVGGQDLSRVVLFNGGGKPTTEATPDLKAAADKAREARLGVWKE
jgi:endonuclease YncB( thermonuclease family)